MNKGFGFLRKQNTPRLSGKPIYSLTIMLLYYIASVFPLENIIIFLKENIE